MGLTIKIRLASELPLTEMSAGCRHDRTVPRSRDSHTPLLKRTTSMQRRKTSLYRTFMCRTFMYKTAAVTVVAALTSHTAIAQNAPAPVPPYSQCSQNVNFLSLLPPPPNSGSPPNPNEDGDTQFLNALIDSTESTLVQDAQSASSLDLAKQIQLVGKLMIY